jgi:hypothetical protein
MSQIVREPETTCKLERGDSSHVCVILEVEFDAEQMLEHILVGASVEGRTKTIHGDNRRAIERRLVRSMPVDMILDTDATRTGCIARWVSRGEPSILPAEVIIIACERD